MRRLTLIALLLVAGSATAGEQVISVQHDSVRGVTCWIVNNSGISCLPDSSLPQVAASPTQAGRASPASSAVNSEPLAAAPLPQRKGFQL